MPDISKEYADALFSVAEETAAAPAFSDALLLIQQQFEAQPAYYDLLASPEVPFNTRQALLEQSLSGAVPEPVLAFVALLCRKGHIRKLPDCIREYEALYRASCRRSVAQVTSVVPLTEEEKARLVKRLEQISGHDVTVHYALDESLLGGLKVQMDDTVIDGSLRHTIKELKEVIGS